MCDEEKVKATAKQWVKENEERLFEKFDSDWYGQVAAGFEAGYRAGYVQGEASVGRREKGTDNE